MLCSGVRCRQRCAPISTNPVARFLLHNQPRRSRTEACDTRILRVIHGRDARATFLTLPGEDFARLEFAMER